MKKLSKKAQKIFEAIATKTINYTIPITPWKLETLQQCQFVVTGLICGDNSVIHRIGYVVQVRIDEYSDFDTEVLIREADGSISIHSNQSYYPISSADTITLMKYFEILPDHDLQNKEGYSIRGENIELDFIVRTYHQ